jgi:phosphatidylethanolamine/phosphatidyl-N-methylethanolamine N-methyltransferase
MKNSSERFYDRAASLYPVVDLFLKPQKRKFFGTINSYPPGRLLEIGVGNGSHLKYYIRHEISGIDTSKKMLARAKKHQNVNIQVLHMSGEALQFPAETFDYVVLSHVIAVVDDPEKVLEEVWKVLKPGGKLFILNHFTPVNWLRYLDLSFEKISTLLHFKSVFQICSLQNIKKFALLSEADAGMFSYFKILTYEKSL